MIATQQPRPDGPRDSDSTAESIAELLSRACKGDRRAWENIVRRYSNVVFAMARSFRLQEADVLDAVQMTWLRLAENAHRIQQPERLAGWLATTTRRECLHILHQGKRAPEPIAMMADTFIDPCVGPEQQAVDYETAQTLWKLVAQLSPLRRALVRALFTDAPHSYTEVARTTGIPLGGIGPTRARALHQLRHSMLEQGLAPSA